MEMGFGVGRVRTSIRPPWVLLEEEIAEYEKEVDEEEEEGVLRFGFELEVELAGRVFS